MFFGMPGSAPLIICLLAFAYFTLMALLASTPWDRRSLFVTLLRFCEGIGVLQTLYLSLLKNLEISQDNKCQESRPVSATGVLTHAVKECVCLSCVGYVLPVPASKFLLKCFCLQTDSRFLV